MSSTAEGMVALNSLILLACAASFESRLDVVHEAHVEHAVGFVKHEVFHVPEIDVTVLEVEQSTQVATRMSTPRRRASTRTLPHTAEDDLVAQTKRTAVDLDAVADLSGQLARWREDEGANGAPSLMRSAER